MSTITSLFAAMLTRNSEDAGTDSPIVLIGNFQGSDMIQYTFPDTVQSDQEKGQANIYEVPILPELGLEGQMFATCYFRVGIRGEDLWRPEHFFLWAVIDKTDPAPLSFNFDLKIPKQEYRTQNVQVAPRPRDMVLSTDKNEGNLSFPLPLVRTGDADLSITRLVMLMTTTDVENAGTDDTVTLQVVSGGNLVVDFDIPDTPQEDLERGQANIYVFNAPGFTKKSLVANSITLLIDGDDAWRPSSFFLFGLGIDRDGASRVVPLVHMSSWTLGQLSTDHTEGSSSVTLPIRS